MIATENKRVVIGLGMTGLSCARYLWRKQQKFSVVDSREQPPELLQFKSEFPDVALSLGEISDNSLAGATQLIVSPGVGLDQPAIHRAIESGVMVCGDIDLFCKEAQAPIIAITGSNGKSTVTSIVGMMAECAGKSVAVGGNIGVPALDLLEQKPQIFVLELSSFQLERTGNLKANVATVLNISPDHMDRYADLQSYQRAKQRIFHGCQQVVINRADPLTQPLLAEDMKVWSFGLDQPGMNGFGLIKDDDTEFLAFQFEKLMPVSELKIVGRHNIENALAALAIGRAAGFDWVPMLSALRAFSGLEHRCQFVAVYDGVRYYNDSKGTNVGAAIAAITGLETIANKVVLIAGGVGKGADFSALLPVLQARVRALVLMGEAADELHALCKDSLDVSKVQNMEEAVAVATAACEVGDVVLLSPACASFDMFNDYRHRGEVFCQSVLDLISERVQ
jgi:UDP-N-acetylmuramoylalanine--D-glutamate ligase